jgi:hypothetical protein
MKTIQKSIQYTVLGMILAMCISCTEKIPIGVDSGAVRLVVDGSFTTDTVIQVVKLKKSTDYFYTLPSPVISNALVTISDGTTTYILHENPSKPGTYQTDSAVFGLVGKTYTLLIKNVDVNNDGVSEEYTATSELRPGIEADSIQITKSKLPMTSDTAWFVKVFAKNMPGEAWYAFKVMKQGVNLSDSIQKWMDNIGYTDGTNPYINGSPVYMSDQKVPTEKLMDGDLIMLESDGITKDYYNFISDFSQEYHPKSPIGSGPSANISTNIKPIDKAIGFFAAYSIHRISKVYHIKK